jgi:adenosylcobinamide-GDP ribazoletransferase
VGVLVGLSAAATFMLAGMVWSAQVAVLLSMVVTLLVTGAFHEDGLADSCDGFGGGMTPADVLRIMQDSRIGAFGTIGLIMALLLKWQVLSDFASNSGPNPAWHLAGLMVASHAASRTMAISCLLDLDYVRETGRAKPVARRLDPRAMFFAGCFGLPWLFIPAFGMGLFKALETGLLAIIVLLFLRVLIGRWFKARLGGYTGDCLGLAQQLGELAIYLSATGLATLHRHV